MSEGESPAKPSKTSTAQQCLPPVTAIRSLTVTVVVLTVPDSRAMHVTDGTIGVFAVCRHTADPGVTRTAAVYFGLLGAEPRDRVLTSDRPASWHGPGRTALLRPGSKGGVWSGQTCWPPAEGPSVGPGPRGSTSAQGRGPSFLGPGTRSRLLVWRQLAFRQLTPVNRTHVGLTDTHCVAVKKS